MAGQLEAAQQDTAKMREVAEDLFNRWQGSQETSQRWFYDYLDVFLIPNTKNILRWFAGPAGWVQQSDFDKSWAASVPIDENRGNMTRVLVSLGLLEKEGEAYRATETGRHYVEHLAENRGQPQGAN